MKKLICLFALAAALPAEDPPAQNTSERATLRIAREAQRAILRLPNFGVFDDIRFSVKGDEVILRGQASRPTLKSSAAQVVKKIEGVEKVTNQIEELPLSPNDDRIRAAVYVNVYYHPSLVRYNPNRGTPLFRSRISAITGITNDPPTGWHPVHIIVKNGNVRLEGVLDTVGDRTVAELQANSTPGVFSVENNIVVANMKKEMER